MRSFYLYTFNMLQGIFTRRFRLFIANKARSIFTGRFRRFTVCRVRVVLISVSRFFLVCGVCGALVGSFPFFIVGGVCGVPVGSFPLFIARRVRVILISRPCLFAVRGVCAIIIRRICFLTISSICWGSFVRIRQCRRHSRNRVYPTVCLVEMLILDTVKYIRLTDIPCLVFFVYLAAKSGGNLAVPFMGVAAIGFPDVVFVNIPITILTLTENIGESNVARRTGYRTVYRAAVYVFQFVSLNHVALGFYRVAAFFRQSDLSALSCFDTYFLVETVGSRNYEFICPIVGRAVRKIADSRLSDCKISLSSHLHADLLTGLRGAKGISFNLHGKAYVLPLNIFRDLVGSCCQAFQLHALPGLQHHSCRIRPVCFSSGPGNQFIFAVPDCIVIDDVAHVAAFFDSGRSNRHPATVIQRDALRILYAGTGKLIRHFFFHIFSPGYAKLLCRIAA